MLGAELVTVATRGLFTASLTLVDIACLLTLWCDVKALPVSVRTRLPLITDITAATLL